MIILRKSSLISTPQHSFELWKNRGGVTPDVTMQKAQGVDAGVMAVIMVLVTKKLFSCSAKISTGLRWLNQNAVLA